VILRVRLSIRDGSIHAEQAPPSDQAAPVRYGFMPSLQESPNRQARVDPAGDIGQDLLFVDVVEQVIVVRDTG
jgi:hypothetical protein